MGTYREVIALRPTSPDWIELPAFEMTTVSQVTDLPDGWQVARLESRPAPDVLAVLMAATGSPVLWLTVDAMDNAYIRGLSAAGAWAGWTDTGGLEEAVKVWLARKADPDGLQSQSSEADEDDEEFEEPDEEFERLDEELQLEEQLQEEIMANAPALAAAVSRWAAEIGRDVSAASVRKLIEGEGADPYGETLVEELVELLLPARA